MAGKINILAAKESSCPICGGTTYKIKTCIGIFTQCKCGMTTQNDIYFDDNKQKIIR